MDFSIKPAVQMAEPGISPKFAGYEARPVTKEANWINLVLYFVAGASLIISAFTVGWYFVLAGSIQSKKDKLAAYEQQLSQLPVSAIADLSTKLRLANNVSKNYPYVSALFSVLEDSVENGIVYDSFDLRTDQGGYVLNLSGIAPDYKTVAQQYDILKSSKYADYLGKISVESLKPNLRGEIEFTFKIGTNIFNKDPETVLGINKNDSQVEVISDVPIITEAATSTP